MGCVTGCGRRNVGTVVGLWVGLVVGDAVGEVAPFLVDVGSSICRMFSLSPFLSSLSFPFSPLSLCPPPHTTSIFICAHNSQLRGARGNCRVVSSAACCEACASAKDCTAWSWNGVDGHPNVGNGLCYPKRNCSMSSPSTVRLPWPCRHDMGFVLPGLNAPTNQRCHPVRD